MYMTAGLLMPIFAVIGAGVDLGQAYMAKTRLQQACDAGVLAGRRSMADGTYDADAITAANNMFEFNYPDDMYGSTGVTFTSSQRGSSEVTGTATATVNTILMRMFVTNIASQFTMGILGLLDPFFIFRDDNRCIHDHIAGTIVVDAE